MGGAGALNLMETCKVPQGVSTCPTHLYHVCWRPSTYRDFLPSYPCCLVPLPLSQVLEFPGALSLSHYFWNPSAPHKTRTRR